MQAAEPMVGEPQVVSLQLGYDLGARCSSSQTAIMQGHLSRVSWSCGRFPKEMPPVITAALEIYINYSRTPARTHDTRSSPL